MNVNNRAKQAVLAAAVALVGAVVAITIAVPSSSVADAPSSASFIAKDFEFDANGTSTSSATITVGGTVSFSYPSGNSMHNVDFSGGPLPTSCTVTAGGYETSALALPADAEDPGWSGTCTFDRPGRYTFICDMHPFMTGTINVVGAAATTSTPTTTSAPDRSPTDVHPVVKPGKDLVSVGVSCPRTKLKCLGTITVETANKVTVGPARPHHPAAKRIFTLAKASFTLKPGAAKTLTLELNAEGAKLVQANRSLALHVVVTARDSYGDPRTTTQRVAVRLARGRA